MKDRRLGVAKAQSSEGWAEVFSKFNCFIFSSKLIDPHPKIVTERSLRNFIEPFKNTQYLVLAIRQDQ
jgi:hypothetical protein